MAAKKRKKKPKFRIKGYKIVTVITFLVLLVYLGGFIISGMGSSEVEVFAAGYGSLDVADEHTGVIIRDETVYTAGMDGTPTYLFAEGEKVKKGAEVCVVKNTANTDGIEEKLAQINDEIVNMQKNRLEFSAFKNDIIKINKSIESSVKSYASKFAKGDISSVYGLKEALSAKVGQRNEIWMTENAESTSNAFAQRDAYISQLSSNMQTIKAETSGLVVFSTDGFEEAYSFEHLEEITKEQASAKTDVKDIYQGVSVKSGAPVFKLVKSNTWFIASYIPFSEASAWEEGDIKYLTINTEDGQISAEAKINHTRTDSGEVYVVFELSEYILDFLDMRQVSFVVGSQNYQGIKVPVDALVEKTMLKIPASCIQQSLGEYCVVKHTDSEDVLVKVSLSSMDEEFAYVAQDYESLKIGDVIYNGIESYVISDVSTKTGVYVVNSSLAEFKPVNILAKNQDFVIIEANTDFGVKIYDSVAANAKNIENKESVY